jgi:hypothetical protein
MKNFTRLFAVSALLTTAAHAVPALAVGDNAELFLTGTLGVRADSNIFLSPTNTSDTIFDVNPGVELVFGKQSAMQGSWNFTENISTYADHDDLNSNLAATSLNTKYEDGKSKVNFNASYNQLNQNSVDTSPAGAGDFLIRRNVFAIGGTGEVSATEKSSVAIGIQYQNSDFERAGFSDSKVATIPVNYYYEMTAKVDMSLGYRYRERSESIGFDTKDHFFNIGARGEFTPKLTGQFAIGLTQRSFSHKARSLSDKSLLGIDSSLTYAATPKTSIQFGLSNDFDTNSQGQQQKNFSARAAVNSNISEVWSVLASVSYRAIDYYQAPFTSGPARIDDYFEGQISATYRVNQNVGITGAFSYRSNKSDLPTSEFDNNVVSIAANFRF